MSKRNILKYILLLVVICNTYNIGADSSVKIKGVPVINQHPELPTGCEATALTMLLNYHGVKVSKTEIANTIPRVRLPYYINGSKYGNHPNEGFIGNPFSSHSYGVFVNPVVTTIEKYLPQRSQNLTGETFDKILAVVKEGRPVMIWATTGMSNVSYTQRWKLPNGEIFSWPNNEHALVVVGYDDKYVYVNDPDTGGQRKFSMNVLINRYNSLGKQAVAILPEDINMKVVIDGQKIELSRSVIKSKDKVMFPLAYLDKIGIEAEYYYDNRIAYLNIEGIQDVIQIKGEKGICKVTTNEGNELDIDYSLKTGITRVNLQDLVDLGTFNYKIDKDSIIITTILNDIKSDIDNSIETNNSTKTDNSVDTNNSTKTDNSVDTNNSTKTDDNIDTDNNTTKSNNGIELELTIDEEVLDDDI